MATSGLGVGNSEHIRARAPRASRTRDDTLDDSLRPRYPLALHHFHDLHAFPAPSLTAIPISYSLLILIPDPSCLPPPRLRPSTFTPGLPCPPQFVWQVEEGGPARQRWTPFLESPGVKRNLGPEAGRRPVGLLGPTRRHRHQETDHRSRQARATRFRSQVSREFVAVSPVPLTQGRSCQRRRTPAPRGMRARDQHRPARSHVVHRQGARRVSGRSVAFTPETR